jgi:hypothetical protein
MTMHRRPLGHGRTLATIAGVLVVLGCWLPWWRLGGGQSGLPPLSGNGFDGAGFIVFLVGIAALALVALPYATGDHPLSIDRWQSYLAITIVGWLALGFRVVGLVLDGAFRFSDPSQVVTNGPGLWLVFVGLIVLSRATFDMAREPAHR